MNRCILTIISILSLLIIMINKADACENELPIPVINGPENRYVSAGTEVEFSGSESYDPDATPNITAWWWQIYYEDEYDPIYTSGELETPTLPYTFTNTGNYRVALWVKGDDGEDDWTPEPLAYADHCEVYVVAVDKIIVYNVWPIDEGPAYRHVGDTIELAAIPAPESAPFPELEWDITTCPEDSTASLTVIQDPDVVALTPDKSGLYQIVASCGSSYCVFNFHAFEIKITSPIEDQTFEIDHDTMQIPSPGIVCEVKALVDNPDPPGGTYDVTSELDDLTTSWELLLTWSGGGSTYYTPGPTAIAF